MVRRPLKDARFLITRVDTSPFPSPPRSCLGKRACETQLCSSPCVNEEGRYSLPSQELLRTAVLQHPGCLGAAALQS